MNITMILCSMLSASSLMYKMPVIMNILRQGRTLGLSPTAAYLDMSSYITNATYNILSGNSLITYGDLLASALQSAGIVILIWAKGPTGSGMSIGHIVAAFSCLIAVTAVVCKFLYQPERRYLLMYYSIIIPLISKGSQIRANALQGHAGVQSSITASISAVAPILKCYIAIVETKDSLLLANAFVIFLLNFTILIQVLWLKKRIKIGGSSNSLSVSDPSISTEKTLSTKQSISKKKQS